MDNVYTHLAGKGPNPLGLYAVVGGGLVVVVLGVTRTMQDERQHRKHYDDKPAAHDRVEAKEVPAFPGRMPVDVIHRCCHVRTHAVLLAAATVDQCPKQGPVGRVA